ncbi:YciI family protein [Streptomyces sp. NPDC050421]|uniref:YciI family protein n=1 Tax=unclassified Streptomyces TaxID=2593676 RepID=UPI0037B9F718
MKHYLLSVVTPADGVPPAPEELGQIMRRVEGFHRELQEAGSWVFDGGLSAPGTATVVRAKDGDTVLTDGPYIEGKEYLGGLSIIKAPDLDAALDWGRKAASAIGLPIEVRPFEGEVEG